MKAACRRDQAGHARHRGGRRAAQFYSQCQGSEQGIYLCASAPLGTPMKFSQRHYQNRTIREGDYVALLVEDSGPGGMFTELGRTAVVGKVPQQMKDELAFTIEARRITLDLLKPGTPCKEVWDTYNAFMRENGRPEEARLYCHGQGYDLVERPLVRHDEPCVDREGHEHRRPPDLRAQQDAVVAVRQLPDRLQRPGRPAAPVPRGGGRGRVSGSMRANVLVFVTIPPQGHYYRKALQEKDPELTVQVAFRLEDAVAAIPEADIFMGFGANLSRDFFQHSPRLKWVHALGTGVDGITDSPWLAKDVLVTATRGIHGVPMSEAALMMMLGLARDFRRTLAQQQQRSGSGSFPSSCSARPSASSASG